MLMVVVSVVHVPVPTTVYDIVLGGDAVTVAPVVALKPIAGDQV
jgi:hypothetical protein